MRGKTVLLVLGGKMGVPFRQLLLLVKNGVEELLAGVFYTLVLGDSLYSLDVEPAAVHAIHQFVRRRIVYG